MSEPFRLLTRINLDCHTPNYLIPCSFVEIYWVQIKILILITIYFLYSCISSDQLNCHDKGEKYTTRYESINWRVDVWGRSYGSLSESAGPHSLSHLQTCLHRIMSLDWDYLDFKYLWRTNINVQENLLDLWKHSVFLHTVLHLD